ncbi:type II secretion system protein PulP [Geomonas silvestris]|uniref:Type II secretion system protein PulP n=1 Tax=Geomonas silvestris TaxID=2740184 RepID=A0A6V8MHJ7_9BACT|nr:type II secretion system protein PulP [Geomonas silvestris]GFO59470.1 type II secretion system protein PulP [Geomonas silvestris]
MNRQKLILCLLLAMLAAAIGYGFLRSPKQERVAALTYRSGVPAGPRKPTVAPPRPAPGAPAPAASQSQVHLALLNQERGHYAGYRRNLFSPIFKEEVKLPPFKPVPVPLPLPPRPAAVPPPLSAPPAAPPPPPPPSEEDLIAREMAKFTFLGFLKKGDERTVFLSKDREIFLAKRGSTLAGKYQVSGLTEDAITIKSLAGGKELVIPLVENRSLVRRGPSTRNP